VGFPVAISAPWPVNRPRQKFIGNFCEYEYDGVEYPVCIPFDLRSRSTHIIGRPGQGKSTTMAAMILSDIDEQQERKEMG
jgi:hypothetical protein